MRILIGKKYATVFGKHAKAAVASGIFQQWCASLSDKLTVRSLTIQSVDFARHAVPKRVLFIKFRADIRNAQGKQLPGIVFLRGHSVGILTVLVSGGEEYAVLVNQARPAIGIEKYPELPAGMIDGAGDVRSAALREIEEEIGISTKKEQLVNLSCAFYGERWNKVYPSPGACDEGVELFLLRKRVSRKALVSFINKTTGLAKEREYITLSVCKLKDLCQETPCAIAHSAYLMYVELKQRRRLS